MMIETLIAMSRYLSARQDDDFVDRLNYLYTPNALLVFTVLISFKQFSGRPLECMFPNKFPGSWEQYAENFCWSEDTYYLPPNVHVATIPENERYLSDKKLSYYQWVPFFLLLQAVFFRAPSFLWKFFCLSSGIRVHDIVSLAIEPNNMEEKIRRTNIDKLSLHISRALQFQHSIKSQNLFVQKAISFFNLNYSACFISFAYLFIKFAYLLNVITQLYLMNKFLETNKYEWYGLDVIRDLINGVPWHNSGYFPRVSLCDFTVRQVANIQRYTVQCVLIINIFNEKIFILLWFWYTFLSVIIFFSIIFWSLVLIIPYFGRRFISYQLELNENFNLLKNQAHVNKFVKYYLKQDGVFVLRMVGLHTGIIFSSELVMHLYKMYYAIESNIKKAGIKNDAEKNNFVNTLTELRKRRKKKRNNQDKTIDDLFKLEESLFLDLNIENNKLDSDTQTNAKTKISMNGYVSDSN